MYRTLQKDRQTGGHINTNIYNTTNSDTNDDHSLQMSKNLHLFMPQLSGYLIPLNASE